MKEITVKAQWFPTPYLYVIGTIVVKNDLGDVLMDDEDMYFTPKKFIESIARRFKTNRFEQIKAEYCRTTHILTLILRDKKQ